MPEQIVTMAGQPPAPGYLDAVRRPVDQARGLPNAHYTDRDVYRTESAALIFDTWAGLSAAAAAPEAGDAVPIDFFGQPLVLIRGHDGQVRVFHNVCRHRGMILIDAPRKIEGAIRCPYHSWCYATTGRLVSTPHVGGPGQNTHSAVDRATLGLVEVRSHIWQGIVWVNLSGTAPEFAIAMESLIARWAEFDGPLYHGGADSRFTLEVACNWKLAVENYCESYHLPWVHPGLNSYSRLKDHYNIIEDDAYAGQGTEVYRQLIGAGGARFPDFPGLSPMWDTAAEYVAVFPNVLLGVHRDHAFAIVLLADGPERTREEVHLFYAQPDTDADLRRQNAVQWRGVFEEDVFVVEGMQRGRHASGFDGGRFSPVMDGPTHCFHAWAAGRLGTAGAPARAAE